MKNTEALAKVYSRYQEDPNFQHLRESNFVPGDGNPEADIMLIGEAPGRVENEKKLPFQGDSGLLLQGLMEQGNITRSELFITNILKYRPQLNRTPREYEISKSLPYLKEEIRIVKPKVIVPLGKIPARAFFPSRDFSSLIGNTYPTKKYIIKVLNHPATMLHSDDEEYVTRVRQMFIDTFNEIRGIVKDEHG